MTSRYIEDNRLTLLLDGLSSENKLACLVSLTTGLRIGDVLTLRTEQVKRTNRPTIRESKTKKARRLYLRAALRRELLQTAGEIWIFEHRTDPTRHRTRQAVWADIKRVARIYGWDAHGLSPHSLRKVYAADLYAHGETLDTIRRRLNHDHVSTTFLYALARQLGIKG